MQSFIVIDCFICKVSLLFTALYAILGAIFDRFDEDGSGTLEANELKTLVSGLHLEMDVDQIKQEMASQSAV